MALYDPWPTGCYHRRVDQRWRKQTPFHSPSVIANIKQMPAVQDDDLISADTILPGPVSPLKATVIHHLLIRIIQSEIHSRLQTPGNSCPSAEWFDSMCQRIDQWHATVPSPTGFTSVEWFEINQSISKVQLYRPTPANPNPSRENLQKAFIAAGETMKMYRNWQRTGNINSRESLLVPACPVLTLQIG